MKTVGVMGDGRTYANTIVMRAVTSDDAMTADWARLPYEVLGRLSSPDHQRGEGRQPGGFGHHLQAARHHRVGMTAWGGGPEDQPTAAGWLGGRPSCRRLSPRRWWRA